MGIEFTPGPTDANWAKLRQDFERQADKALRAYRAEIERTWKEKAEGSLSTTYDEYMRGVTFNVEQDGLSVQLSGWLPVAMEEGAERFDMKPGLLGGRQSRVIRLHNGKFRTVSLQSPAWSWWHPGIEARKIGEQVKAEEPRIRSQTIEPFLSKFWDGMEA